jgi:hypothetical protein
MRLLLLALMLPVPVFVHAQTAPAPAPPPLTCAGPEYRQFDFWLGEWDVVPNPDTIPPGTPPPPPGQRPASNVIVKAHDGCVLVENWTAPTQTGQSFNIYDRASGRWHQTWVDSNGGLHEYWGNLVGGAMVFHGEVPLGPGTRAAGRRTVRLTFTRLDDTRVRQFSEGLNADGTWSVNYDLIYSRRAPKP